MQPRRSVKARFGAVVSAAALAATLAACSPVAYPSLNAEPTPRADDPMTQNDVQQATSALISDRTKLSNDATAAQASAVAAGMNTPLAPTTGTQTAGAGTKP